MTVRSSLVCSLPNLCNATTAMQFHPIQQKCSLLQGIPLHSSFISQVDNTLGR